MLKKVVFWMGGVALGFLPIVLMALLIPGFAVAFWESVQLLFEQKTTNLPLPVPWPWTINFSTMSTSDGVRGILVGLFFMGIIVFGGVAPLWVVYRRVIEKPVPPALIAAAFLALPYAHFAFSRADIGHLAQGIFPLLLGCLVLLSTCNTWIKWPLTLTLCISSLWTLNISHPGWRCQVSGQWITVEVSGRDLQMEPGTANNIALLRELVAQYASNEQSFITIPFWPGAYALMEKQAPMWEIYALFPRSNAFENREIARIRASKPSFALVSDMPLDGRDELRFKNTHPLIYQYIVTNFDPVHYSKIPANHIYVAR